jgi:transcriptional regulator with PAS, ATPase and Fis domain
LENRTVTRLGANKLIDIDVRLICATNMDIRDMVAVNRFRQDLLYRINTVEIHIPPLRERLEDIPFLADHFIKIYNKKYNKPLKRLNSATKKRLEKYPWPGNVRELQHAMERAIIMSESQVLQPSDFFFPAGGKEGESLMIEDFNLEEIEKLVIHRAISKYSGNISQVAKELGLSRASLYRRLEKYGL